MTAYTLPLAAFVFPDWPAGFLRRALADLAHGDRIGKYPTYPYRPPHGGWRPTAEVILRRARNLSDVFPATTRGVSWRPLLIAGHPAFAEDPATVVRPYAVLLGLTPDPGEDP